MAKYRKVSVLVWNDRRFRGFSDDAKLVFLFLLTHPHMSSVGGMRATLSGLAEELGWTLARLSKAFQEPSERGMVWFDQEAHLMVLPNFIKHNPPESPNVVKAWGRAFEELPESPLKARLFAIMRKRVKSLSKAFQEAFESLLKDFSNQEQEQEQEGEEGSLRSPSSCPESAPPGPPRGLEPVAAVVCKLPLNDGSEFDFTESHLAELGPLYPAVEIEQELRNMRGWLIANPQKRKTRRGIMRFVNGWLSRGQDRGGSAKGPPATPAAANLSQQRGLERQAMARHLINNGG